MNNKVKKLRKAMKNMTAIQTKMALILLHVNGEACAMEYVEGVTRRPVRKELDEYLKEDDPACDPLRG
jgi:hypothetical protein